MGISVRDKSEIIEDLVQNLAYDFIGEVFMEELNFLLDEEIYDSLIVKNHGMNTRAESKDVLYVDSKYISVDDEFKENMVLHLSRNSIYHQLPEILFHPLSIESKKGNAKEVVDKIRINRKKEQENLEFFSIFDTEIFKESVKINNRSLNFLFDTKSKQNVLEIFRRIVGTDLHLSDKSFYKLFLNLCRSEFYKENLPELEKLIEVVLGLSVKIDYIPCKITASPFPTLGGSVLGVDFGFSGDVFSEIDDIKVVILLKEKVENYKTLEKNILLIKEILSFFILSQRQIYVSYENEINTGMVLSESFLGYDSCL